MLDLLILGAGPAGCAAAMQARRAGLKVLLLEASSRVRPTPGETLHPGIEAIFAKLGVLEAVLAAQFHRHRGVWIAWDESYRFEAYGEDATGAWLGFQAERRRLHEILQNAAEGAGAKLRRAVTPEAVLLDGAEVKGVRADGQEIHARWTADATGRDGWLACALKLDQTVCSPTMHVRFGWSADCIQDVDAQPRITATPSGWEWRAPLGNTRAAWVKLAVDRPEEPISRQSGTDVSWQIRANCAGPGYFLLGDAAATLDLLSSHGVLRAIMSGMLCAHLAAGNFHGHLPQDQSIDSYKSWIRGQFEHDVRTLRTLYRRHPSAELATLF